MAIIRFFPLRYRYINCDVEISHPIIILVCLCIGGYYITLILILIYIYIYIYIYIVSLLVEGGEPDDGHKRPKHVVLLQILEYTSFI